MVTGSGDVPEDSDESQGDSEGDSARGAQRYQVSSRLISVGLFFYCNIYISTLSQCVSWEEGKAKTM